MQWPSLGGPTGRFSLAVGVLAGLIAAFVVAALTGPGSSGPSFVAVGVSVALLAAGAATNHPNLPRYVTRRPFRSVAVSTWVAAALVVFVVANERVFVPAVVGLCGIFVVSAVESTAASVVLAAERDAGGVVAEWTAQSPRRWTWTVRLAGLGLLVATAVFFVLTFSVVGVGAVAASFPLVAAVNLLTVVFGALVALGVSLAVTANRERQFVLTDEVLFVRVSNGLNWTTIPTSGFRGVERTDDALVLRRGLPWPVGLHCRWADLDVEAVIHERLG